MTSTLHTFLSILANLLVFSRRVRRRALMLLYRTLFATHGRNFRFDPDGEYSFRQIRVGDDVNLGVRPTLSARGAFIRIGDKVMFGPQVTIMGGNHTISLVGRYMFDVTASEKRPDDDLGVTIEDDVWIGTQAVILHGVKVGRGAVVGAGAVVTRDVPPYSLVVGVPAKVLRFRWDVDTIIKHEAALYPKERRLSRSMLEEYQKNGSTPRRKLEDGKTTNQ